MIIDKVVVSVMASVAAITVLSACSSQEQLTAGSSQSASDFDSLLISAETSDKLSEWSSGMPLGKHDAFISDLGIDISKATLPNPVLILTRQAQAVVPYGTKCVIVFTSEKVSSPSRISGWIAYRFNGPQVKYGFGNWDGARSRAGCRKSSPPTAAPDSSIHAAAIHPDGSGPTKLTGASLQ